MFNNDIDGSTKLVCLLGHPIDHSLSPFLYNNAFNDMNINYKYMAFNVTEDNLSLIVKALSKMNVVGCNLTMPLKRAIFNLLDDMSDDTNLIKSANTIVFKNNKIYGDTTDGRGFLKALLDNNFDYNNKNFTIIGFGGAGSSIVSALSKTHAKELNIIIRKESKYILETIDMINKQSNINISLYTMKYLSECIKRSDILVNTTYVGMKENDPLLVNPKDLRKDLFVADIIYNPLETNLLKEAKKRGCKTMNGLFMLYYQAALSFELFTGKYPSNMPFPY